MKLKLLSLVTVILLSGCSTTGIREIPHDLIGVQTSIIAGNNQVQVIEIPSHGALGDSLAIKAKGGANATALKNSLVNLIKLGGGGIAVTSRNPALSRAVIEGALVEGNYKNKNVTLIYAGDKINSDSIKPVVEGAGIKYGFVDISK